MNRTNKLLLSSLIIICLCTIGLAQAWAAGVTFNDPDQMSDMSDFDPNNPVIPTGDTIKIAIVASFSGPAAVVGQIYWISALWAAHDIKREAASWSTASAKRSRSSKQTTRASPPLPRR